MYLCIACMFILGKHVCVWGGGEGGKQRTGAQEKRECREGRVDGVGSEIPKVARSWRNSAKICNIVQYFAIKKSTKQKKGGSQQNLRVGTGIKGYEKQEV